MKRDVSVRAGVVLQLTFIAVASLSLLAVFALKAIETSMERRLGDAAVAAAEIVRNAVEGRGGPSAGGRAPSPDALAHLSPDIREVAFLPDRVPEERVGVVPVGDGSRWPLSLHPMVDVTLPVSAGPEGVRAIRVRYYSPGAAGEARNLLVVSAALVGADVVVFVLFGFFLMDRSVVRPLKRLAAISETIADGNYRLRADEAPKNEVGQLGASFNRMIEAILFAQERVRQAQRESFRAEKLATVGRLAAGVAHEVGNPLMAVRGYAEYLKEHSPGREEQEACLGKVVSETKKIENIVRGLLSVVSPGEGMEGETDVNAVVRETVETLSFRKLFRSVAVDLDLGDVGCAKLPAERFRQVLLNLLINAVDAMENGGTLRVTTCRVLPWLPPELRGARRRASDPPGVDVARLRGGDAEGVAVRVSDSGCGIRPEDLRNIFDPFFTTKEPGKGTGLGLSVSRTIVDAAGGEILAESDEGKGATFTVILPASREGTAGTAEPAEGRPDA